jgi:hypothetical protein
MQSGCLPAIAEKSVRSGISSEIDFSPSSPLSIEILPDVCCNICVIVPVCNEADHISATLFALNQQYDLQGERLDPNKYEVIVLANNCTDNSAALARQAAKRCGMPIHVVERSFVPADAYIGRVRQLLMDEAYYRLITNRQPRGIIASTDGDTCVAPTWLAAIQHEIDRGADGVSGRIMTASCDRARLDPHTRACYLRAIGYGYLCVELESHLDPDPFDCLPRHHQHCGASLAVTAEMYAKAGGMPPVRTPEDVAFYRSLMRVEARFRHSPLVWVKTSARQQGRTANGMANQLHVWSAMGNQRQPYLVDSALAVETRLQSRRELRQAWQTVQQGQLRLDELQELAERLCVDLNWLGSELEQAVSFGVLHERVEARQAELGRWQQRWLQVPIEQAITDLRTRISHLRQVSSSSGSR